MFFAKKNLIGLDYGSSTIKMAELEVSKNQAKLISFGIMPTPAQSVNGGELADLGSVGAAIQTLYSDLKIKSTGVCAGLWGTAVIVKKISMPKMERKMVQEQIRFEAEQYIPFDINNISLDFHILKSSPSPDTMDLLLVAAQNELVSQYKAAVEYAKLKCEIIDVSGFALSNCFEFNHGLRPDDTLGLLNFGASVTNFSIIHLGETIFTRDVPVGGSNYTSEIHKTMGITFQEAELLKIEATNKKEVPDEVHSVISLTNEAISEEIRNTLDFVYATVNGITVKKFYYTGGASNTAGLIETLSKSLNAQFEALNPFKKVVPSQKKVTHSYMEKIRPFAAVALGLGLRKAGDN